MAGVRRAALALGRFAVWHIGRLGQLGLDGGQVGVEHFVDQVALIAAQRFALVPETDAAVIGQLQRQRVDFEVLFSQLGVLLRQQPPGLLALLDKARTCAITAGSCWARVSSVSKSMRP